MAELLRQRQRPARLTRRDFLAVFGLGGVAVAITAACGGDGESGESEASGAAAGAGSDTPACVLMPDATERPFYFDTEMLRQASRRAFPGRRSPWRSV